MIVEGLGLLAGIMVAASFFMKEVIRLRLVNCIGASLFVIYGIIIGSVSVAALNAFVIGVNLFYSYQAYKGKK